jgi:hypothetical protein
MTDASSKLKKIRDASILLRQKRFLLARLRRSPVEPETIGDEEALVLLLIREFPRVAVKQHELAVLVGKKKARFSQILKALRTRSLLHLTPQEGKTKYEINAQGELALYEWMLAFFGEPELPRYARQLGESRPEARFNGVDELIASLRSQLQHLDDDVRREIDRLRGTRGRISDL